MPFRHALERHLQAIRDRDLTALASTLPADDEILVLVRANGEVVRSVQTFLASHRDWFSSPTWTLDFEKLASFEAPELAVVTYRLDYRDTPGDGPALHERSILTLVFARRDGQWVLVLDQNTPERLA